jgi:undecaprenyl-diphosphatase
MVKNHNFSFSCSGKILILVVSFVVIALATKLGFINSLDQQLSALFYNTFNISFITVALILLTNFTIGSFWGVAAATIWIIAKKNFKVAALFAASAGIESLIVQVIKLVVARSRPYSAMPGISYLGDNVPTEFSFPSGHTTLAFFVAYSVCKILKLNKRDTILVYLLASLVAFSRLYLGAHFVLDVVGGIILGTLLGMVSMNIFSKFKLLYNQK